MPSLQSKFMSAMIRIVVRRRDWGNEQQLVRRARRIFGTPRPFQWMWTRGVDIKGANLHYLSGSGPSVRFNDGKCAMFRTENIRDFARAYLGAAYDHALRDPRASPIFADLRGLTPVLLHVGSSEILLDDSRIAFEGLGGE